MPTTHDLIKKAISNERTRMVDDGEVEDFVDINRGFCEDFAFEVMAIVMNVAGRKSDELGIADVSIVNFVKVHPSTGCAYDYGGPFDRDLLAERYPATEPPEGLTWEDMDALSAFHGFYEGTHILVEHAGRLYDAEVPEGVDNLFALPFFSRVIAIWRNADSPAPTDDHATPGP